MTCYQGHSVGDGCHCPDAPNTLTPKPSEARAEEQLFAWAKLLGVTDDYMGFHEFFLALNERGRQNAWEHSAAYKRLSAAEAEVAHLKAKLAAVEASRDYWQRDCDRADERAIRAEKELDAERAKVARLAERLERRALLVGTNKTVCQECFAEAPPQQPVPHAPSCPLSIYTVPEAGK